MQKLRIPEPVTPTRAAPALRAVTCLVVLALMVSCAAPRTLPQEDVTAAATAPPALLFGEFFEKVAMSGLFEDSKQWADAVPLRPPAEILAAARDAELDSDQALRRFLGEHFDLAPVDSEVPAPPRGLPLGEHVAALWPLLTRQTPETPPFSSRLPLPHPYVVPGGRFREVYYWDSYFTMLGFGPEQDRLMRAMVSNFAHLIRTYGHVPNGNRSYYLSRSQPPFFFLMVSLLAPERPARAYAEFLTELKAEHGFWMRDAAAARPGQPARRVVVMPDGSLLNRYWDARDTPRDESFREDVEVAAQAGRPAAEVYRDLRAAAESGWDFSSRWMADGESLATTRTTGIVPVDLNSLLYGLERAIAAGCREVRDAACETDYSARAASRRDSVRQYLWNDESGLFDDWHWPEQRLLGHVTAAAVYPLFTGLARDDQAARVASAVADALVEDGGIVTTDRNTGEQWDAPNGWAPLQWLAVQGFRRYGEEELAHTVACRWVTMVSSVFLHTGRLLEKYDVVTLTPGGGGEYPLQDGFGWTNGVTVALLRAYPDLQVPEAEVRRRMTSCPGSAILSAGVPDSFPYAATDRPSRRDYGRMAGIR